tara:strand:- start:175 stop:498 length:324 start_codon:yes stop_codon:yes gene_type:complete
MPDEKYGATASNIEKMKVLEKNVTLAATPETLTTDVVLAGSYVIKSKPGNSGVVYISDSVSGPWFPADGVGASATQDKTFNLKDVFLKVSTDGDGVFVLYHSTGIIQ